ncbi:ABC transporter substrate binding protein [Pseudomonas aeruginosa]
MARKFIGDKPDVIVGIATPSAQALVAATKSIPIVFSTVTDPVGAHHDARVGKPRGTNVTGVSEHARAGQADRAIEKVVPGARSAAGTVSQPGRSQPPWWWSRSRWNCCRRWA